MDKLDKVGTDLRRNILVTSGDRSPFEAWQAYADYLSGGNLAAFCCAKHYRHGWEQCGKQPTSNHCRGLAADCLVEAQKKGSTPPQWVNIGDLAVVRKALRDRGLCLPVGSGETWHVEVGDTWNS